MTLGCVVHCVHVGVSVPGDMIGSRSRRGEVYLNACTREVLKKNKKKNNLNNMNQPRNDHICNHCGHCLKAWEVAQNLMEANALQILYTGTQGYGMVQVTNTMEN